MSVLFAWIARLASRRAHALLGIGLILTATFGLGYARLGFDNDPELITLDGSRALDFYRGFLERWGSDELIVIAYEVSDAFTPTRLAQLRSLTDDLFELEGVRWVWSLDSAFRVDTGPFGPFVRPLVPDELGSGDEVRVQALASPFVRGSLVSADGRMLALHVQLEGAELNNNDVERAVLEGIETVLARPAYEDLDFHIAGSPVFNRELSRLNKRDNALFTPVAVSIVAMCLLVMFRSVVVASLILAIVGGTLVWTLGTMGWLGVPMNTTTSLLPPLLMVIAVADSIHIVSGYLDRLRAGDTRQTAVHLTLRDIGPACFWTSFTTICGFASLLLVRIESVRTFGIFAVLGVAAGLVLSVGLLPAALRVLPLERIAKRRSMGTGSIGSVASRPHPRLAVGLIGAALALGIPGVMRVEVATHDGEFFAEANPLNRAYRTIEERMHGVTPLEVEVRAPTAGALRTPEALRSIAALQAQMGSIPELTAGVSVVDLLRSSVPDADLANAESVDRSLFLLETVSGRQVRDFVAEDYRLARVSARAMAMTSARSEAILDALADDAVQTFPAGWRVEFTGLVPVFSQMEQYLVEGQLRSYGIAVLGVTAAFLLVFRSLRLTLIALVPNAVPILLTAAVMGFGGIRLDVVTIMVASVALGIIVDDTIHIVSAFQRAIERGNDADRALHYALEVAARPVFLTSVILTMGFGVLVLSGFQPTAHFGMLVGTTILAALIADLGILPAALVRFAPLRTPHPSGAPAVEPS